MLDNNHPNYYDYCEVRLLRHWLDSKGHANSVNLLEWVQTVLEDLIDRGEELPPRIRPRPLRVPRPYDQHLVDYECHLNRMALENS